MHDDARTKPTRATMGGLALALALSLAAPGCGTQGDERLLKDQWPRSGLSGYVIRDPESAHVFSRLGWDLDQPALEPSPGSLAVWMRMAPRGAAEQSVLARGELPTSIDFSRPAPPRPPETPPPETSEVPVLPAQVLEPRAAWEGRSLRSPSFVADAALPEGPLLVYQGEDGAVGALRYTIPGKAAPTQPLLTGAEVKGSDRIGAIFVGGEVRIYFIAAGREVYYYGLSHEALAGYLRGDAAPPAKSLHGPLLHARDYALPRLREDPVPADQLSGLSVRRVETPAGRVRIDLCVVASASGPPLVKLPVSAAAYADPAGGERLLPVSMPLLSLEEGAPETPSFASLSAQHPTRPSLLFGLRTIQSGIAVGVLE